MTITWDFRRAPVPRMAWLAECTADTIVVHHGGWVEKGHSWFFEGAWAGSFAEAEFGSAATVMGSGAVMVDGGVLFVPPSHTLEGLYYHAEPHRFTISNSLIFLLERLGAKISNDPHMGRRFASAV